MGVGTEEEARSVIAHPDLWHVRKSVGILSKLLLATLQEMFSVIEAHADENTVMAFSTLSLAARLAQEKLKIPAASVHLQPGVFRSVEEQGMFVNLRLSAAQPRWLKRMVFRLADTLVLDRHIKGPVNEFRARLGLAPVTRIMHRWVHSPQLVIGLFPDWFAAPQPDWPQNLHLVGFPQWDADPAARYDEAVEFLESGPAPLIFTPGSAAATMHAFFRESVQAAHTLKMRAMLITNYPEQIPAALPPGVRTFGYVPFSQILPRSALLVHHGGIGTLAQGIRAAVPQLIVPHAYDQFDNAWRLKQLQLGDDIPIHSYREQRAVRAMRCLLERDDAGLRRRRDYAHRIDPPAAIARAVRLIEQLQAVR